MAATETPTYIGASVPRREDKKLLTGQGSFVDNLTLPGMLWMALVRSPYAHARITKVDVAPALAHADVVAAWSGADLAEDWLGSLPCAWIPTEDTNHPNHAPLAVDVVRHAGDGVAVVAARSRAGMQLSRKSRPTSSRSVQPRTSHPLRLIWVTRPDASSASRMKSNETMEIQRLRIR